ncbi:MAG: hypothetical protein IH939_13070 [Acidobacteria bacterium]|nr:hypothetical protein [Acidobacteriota bacterium]
MEYLDGEILAQRLEEGALPLGQALQVAIESGMRWTRRTAKPSPIGI